MKALSRSSLWLLASLVLLLGDSCSRPTQARPDNRTAPNTTVYIVRHAEKDLAPNQPDPPLTPAGQLRALALRDSLAGRLLAAVFSTSTSRTRATAAPLTQALRLPVLDYNPRQLPALARRIRREYAGRTVLVVGHSNTVLETAEALGAARPVPAINDNEYDYLLEVTVPPDSTRAAAAVARRYGSRSVSPLNQPALQLANCFLLL